MITRRTLEGAWKCSLRLFLRLEWRWELIFVISAVFVDGGGGWSVSSLSPGRRDKTSASAGLPSNLGIVCGSRNSAVACIGLGKRRVAVRGGATRDGRAEGWIRSRGWTSKSGCVWRARVLCALRRCGVASNASHGRHGRHTHVWTTLLAHPSSISTVPMRLSGHIMKTPNLALH